MVRRAVHHLGYDLRRINANGKGYTLHQYVRDDGSFDYERYVRIQTEGNKLKLNSVWAQEDNIVLLSEYIQRVIGQPKFGICHGTRCGKEQEWFRQQIGCDVIGTEISDTATQFSHTIQWDFHDSKDEWLDAVDFIYSNSFDHSYDPEKCLNTWMNCVRPGGICILEHSSFHRTSTELDPFGSELIHLPYFVLKWGRGRYGVRDLVPARSQPSDSVRNVCFLVIQRHAPCGISSLE